MRQRRRLKRSRTSADDAENGDSDHLIGLYFVRTIVAAALCEGAAFLDLVAFWLEDSPIALLAAALAIAGVVVPFPTVSRFENWLDDQERLIAAEREFRT